MRRKTFAFDISELEDKKAWEDRHCKQVQSTIYYKDLITWTYIFSFFLFHLFIMMQPFKFVNNYYFTICLKYFNSIDLLICLLNKWFHWFYCERCLSLKKLLRNQAWKRNDTVGRGFLTLLFYENHLYCLLPFFPNFTQSCLPLFLLLCFFDYVGDRATSVLFST